MMYLKLAWRNLWRSKLRTGLSIASIVAAFYFSSMLISLQVGMHEQYLDNILNSSVGHIQVMDTAYWNERDMNLAISVDLSNIDSTKIKAICPRIETGMLVSTDTVSRAAFIIGMDPENETPYSKFDKKIKEGRFITGDDNGIVINKQLAENLNVSVGDSIILYGYGYHMAQAVALVPIVGIGNMIIQNQGVVILPINLAADIFDTQGKYTSYMVFTLSAEKAEQLIPEISQHITSDRIEVKSWNQLIPGIVKQIEFENNSNKVIGAILFVIVAFGILGTIIMMTQERKREFGILLSIGQNRKSLAFVLLLESILLTGFGLFIGFLISYGILSILHNNPIPLPGEAREAYEKFGVEALLQFSIDPSIFIEQILFVFTISLLIALYPIIKIYNLDIVKAVRD